LLKICELEAGRALPFSLGCEMTEDDVISIVLNHLEGQFPKTCSNCGLEFKDLKDYLLNTTHLGDPVSYDAEVENWQSTTQFGTFSHANCNCGNTLTITSKGIGIMTMFKLLGWAKKESHERGISVNKLLAALRVKIDSQVLD